MKIIFNSGKVLDNVIKIRFYDDVAQVILKTGNNKQVNSKDINIIKEG